MQDQVALGAALARPPLSRAASPAPLARETVGGKRLTFSRSSYIMAALDRVIHHSVILDMMELESYRARAAQLRLQGEGGELTE